MAQPTSAIPVLPVNDLTRSIAWYERLGFACAGEWDGYAILTFDGTELHLATGSAPPPGESSSGAYLRVSDADAVFARWTAVGAPVVSPPTDQPYGIREFATEDLDGNLWRVGAWLVDELDDGDDDEYDDPYGGRRFGDLPYDDVFDADGRLLGAEPEPDLLAPVSPEARADGGPGTTDDAWFALVDSGVRCAGCGLVIGELPARALGAQVRDEVHSFGELLAEADDDAVRRRPGPTTWSALEYGVHTRDLLTVFAERVIRTLAEHDPLLGWWDHEAAITDGMANESDVPAVVDDMGRNAAKLSEALRLVTDDDWDRPATRRSGERFTIESMARFALHEVVHHRGDAERALEAVR